MGHSSKGQLGSIKNMPLNDKVLNKQISPSYRLRPKAKEVIYLV